LFLPDLKKKIEFSLYRFSGSAQISNFMKSHSVGTYLFHAEEDKVRQTDRSDEGNTRFSQFCERA